MSREDQADAGVRGKISINGNNTGQVQIGTGNYQHQTIARVTGAEPTSLDQLIEALRAQIEAEAPADKRVAAQVHVDDLSEALKAEKPDLEGMARVRDWFARHVPTLVGAVTSVVVNPIVGTIVAAAGDGLVDEFRQRFSQDGASGERAG
jgi:hypothetical protein